MSITTPNAEVELRAEQAVAVDAGEERPATLAQLQAVLRRYRDTTTRIRIAGLNRRVERAADELVIDMSGLRGIAHIDKAGQTATFLAGTTVDEAAAELEAHGYSMVSAPADTAASLGGAVSVGAHGYSPKDTNFSASIVDLGLLTVDGNYLTVSARKNAEYWAAARLGLGVVGIITHVTVRIRKYQALRAQRFTRTLDEMLAELNEARSKVDFYRAQWKPTAAKARVEVGWLEDASPAAIPARTFTPPANPEPGEKAGGFRNAIRRGLARVLPKLAPIVDRVSTVVDRGDAPGLRDGRDVAGRSEHGRVMEYLFPQRAIADAIADLGELARVSHNFGGTRVRLSMIESDRVLMSAAYGEPVVALAIEAHGARAEAAFREAEELFIRRGGLPNWGTWNTFNGAEAADVMPRFGDFSHAVHDLDPHGRLVSGTASRLQLH